MKEAKKRKSERKNKRTIEKSKIRNLRTTYQPRKIKLRIVMGRPRVQINIKYILLCLSIFRFDRTLIKKREHIYI